MPVPTYDKFIEPIIRYLVAHPDGRPAKEAHEAAAAALGLADIDKLVLLPSGTQPIYKNRAGWAHDRLKRAGLSSSPQRGFWKLTEEGAKFAASNPAPLSPDKIGHIAIGFMGVVLKPTSSSEIAQPAEKNTNTFLPSAISSPDERLGEAIAELRQSVAAELLETLGAVSPTYFETIVLDLLHKMGYGASRADLQQVGGSGDGGIDGVISLDKLGLEKVYVQAKRWQQSVGRPEVQAFYGALAGNRANKGVFITTSTYTAQAIEFAKSVERVVLVDGKKLADLMMDNEVGVSARLVKVPKIDSDYFDEESA
ncbi:MAG: restriction endonuclease [Nitrosomonadaceae bacterium]|nr:restriction endonuclease [Nitrosomonadaceae bacterium]